MLVLAGLNNFIDRSLSKTSQIPNDAKGNPIK